MSITEKLEPTAKLRWVRTEKQHPNATKKVLQQWWSNQMNVRMGPTQMIKGEWRDVPVEEVQ